jgi:tetratricopeptide (TPR) repeat protein
MLERDPRKPADASYVDLIRAASQHLIRLDIRWDGNDVARLAARTFRKVQRLITSGGHRRGIEQDLHAAGAELAEVAGWVAFDAGEQALAAELNTEALTLARLAGDRDIEHLTLLNMSLQAGYLNQPGESVAIAQSVIDNGVTPRVHAMALIRQARAHSRSGNRADALRIFDQAQSMFLDGLSDRDPVWAWWIDADEIEGQFGAAHAELGDHRRSIPLLYNAVSSVGTETPRYRIVFAAQLLSELVAASAWRDAQQAAEDLAAHPAGISSARTMALLRKTAAVLSRQAGAPSTLQDTVRHVGQSGGYGLSAALPP